MLTYNNLLSQLGVLKDKYSAEVGSIGYSTLKNDIPYIFFGDKSKAIIVTGGIHAREHITCELVLKMATQYLKYNKVFCGGIYFIPMVNVDGVRLCQEGLGWIKSEKIKQNLLKINSGEDFSLWKANAKGVDLNVNFDAHWGKGASNVFEPSAANYVGRYPHSEVETRCLADFTRKAKPLSTISYHAKGEVIYYRFYQQGKRLWRDYNLAKALSIQTGYGLLSGSGSVGGYKDWCVEALQIPAFTLEIGRDNVPYYALSQQLEDIWEQNKNVPSLLLSMLVK